MSKRYVAGLDGGGSTTVCILADELGNLLTCSVSEGSNHQIAGMAATVKVVCGTIDAACAQIGIVREELSYIYMGIAGADLEEDHVLLNMEFGKAFSNVPFSIVNDIWIALECGTELGWGAVSVCGTGSNIAVKRPDGRVFTVRALRYMLGNYGGGAHLSEIALHHAFRCEEYTGVYTRLAEMLPAFCECESMEELARRIYESNYTYHTRYNIPKLVFDLADCGDTVCSRIINEMGREIGEMLAGLIQKAGLASERLQVILSGSQYTKDHHRVLISAVEKRLLKDVLHAEICVVRCPPALGAIFGALHQIGAELSAERRRDIQSISEADFARLALSPESK